MARQTEPCRSAKGLYVRNLGWKATPKGYAQHKFYLGRDEDQARLTNLRLQQLWQQIEDRWQRENAGLPPSGTPGIQVSTHTTALGQRYTNVSSVGLAALRTSDRPLWDETTLLIAEAVRLGEPVARLPVPASCRNGGRSVLAYWLGKLQEDITVVKLEVNDTIAQQAVEETFEADGQRLMGLARKLLQKRVGGETLYAALDAYRKWVESRCTTAERLSAWGGAQVRQIKFLRRQLPNCALNELDGDRIEELVEVIRQRPLGKNKQRTSVSWARNCLKQLRSFLKWLNKSQQFDWKRPADFEWSPAKVPVLPEEKAVRLRSPQVETYKLDELKTCWEYATPFQRLLMLLTLNCGFGRAEIASLDLAEVHLRQPHPLHDFINFATEPNDSWISRLRGKTTVYGEWKLWPETVAAIEWWLRQRADIALREGVTKLLVTKSGRRYDEPTAASHANSRISNSWSSLTRRIKRDMLKFRSLSFNKLRKTAGTFVRDESNGEIAATFLAHGKPVKEDDLLDLYTNRPFEKVHEAIDRVGEKLRLLWSDVQEPFPQERKQGGPNISLGKIKRIKAMRKQGYKIAHIAETVGVSTTTVRRWSAAGSDEG